MEHPLDILIERNNYMRRQSMRMLSVVDDVWPSLEAELNELVYQATCYINWVEYSKLVKKYPDRAFIKDKLALEGWSPNQTIKNMLNRFKMFFKRIWHYIQGFVVLRINAAKEVINQWAFVLEDTSRDEQVKKLAENYKTKDVSAETIYLLITQVMQVYNDANKRLNSVKSLSNDAIKQGSTQTEDLTKVPESTAKFNELLNQLEAQNPKGHPKEGTQAGSQAMEADKGKWYDKAVVRNLANAVNTSSQMFKNMRAVQLDLDKLIADLERTDSTPRSQQTDNTEGKTDSQINAEANKDKIQLLREYSKDVLGTAVNTLVKCASLAAAKCKVLNTQLKEGATSNTEENK